MPDVQESRPDPPKASHPEIEASLPGGFKVRIHNVRKLDYLVIFLCTLFALLFWKHMHDTTKLTREQIKAQTQVANAVRFNACIQAVPIEQRMAEIRDYNSLCNMIGKSDGGAR